MPTQERHDASKIGGDYTVRLPERVRERLDVSPGDRVEWRVTDDDELEVEVIEQEYGAFEDAEAVSLGGAADDHDCMGLDF